MLMPCYILGWLYKRGPTRSGSIRFLADVARIAVHSRLTYALPPPPAHASVFRCKKSTASRRPTSDEATINSTSIKSVFGLKGRDMRVSVVLFWRPAFLLGGVGEKESIVARMEVDRNGGFYVVQFSLLFFFSP